ncbi:MAG: L-rhamnose/proton symporter RhaT [Terracidiphilus sp.]
MAGTASGWALLLVAGASNATFGLPMKFVRGWRWENTWAGWTAFALIILPVAVAIGCVPSLAIVYRGPGLATAAIICLFGMGWGLAQVLFGKAMDLIGIGLAFAIVLGISSAAGTLFPLFRMDSSAFESSTALRLMPGLLFVALGVTACAIAGNRREAAQSANSRIELSFTPGLLMALASGVLASFMNVGLSFAPQLLARTAAVGIGSTRGMFAVWLPLLLGGAAPNLLYCIVLLRRNRTWPLYRGADRALNISLVALMAALWFFSTVFYGIASQNLGPLGVVLGWPVFMAVIVISAGLIGMATGEWKHCGKTPILIQVGGILLLVLAIVSFARAQNLTQPAQPTVSFVDGYVR